jgi:hypothetical protein
MNACFALLRVFAIQMVVVVVVIIIIVHVIRKKQALMRRCASLLPLLRAWLPLVLRITMLWVLPLVVLLLLLLWVGWYWVDDW